MGVPPAVRSRYAQDEPALRALLHYVRPTLERYSAEHEYRLDARTKSLESVAEKLETGRYTAWSELDDLIGFTIVVPTTRHIGGVVHFLDSSFERTTLRDRSTASTPLDQFRFNSARWYGRVPTVDPLPRLESRALDIVFEVQVHTAFEHAWVVVTHDLVYKGGAVTWQDRRLAAQLRALVEQLDVTAEHFELVASKLPTSGYAEVDAMGEAIEQIKSLIEDGFVDTSMAPASWTRFAENLLGLARQGGDRRAAPGRLRQMVTRYVEAIRNNDFQVAVSGSLFQSVVAHAIQSGIDASRVALVDDVLGELYRITPVKRVNLDG